MSIRHVAALAAVAGAAVLATSVLVRRGLLVAAAGLALAAAGCSDDSVYSGGGGDSPERRAAREVVRDNLYALARGDARTYCGSYTPKFLRTYRDSHARCVAGFKEPPDPRARVPRIEWKDFLTSGDEDKVAVAFTADGGAEQTYYLERHGGRWLIDSEAVERE